MEQLHSEKVRHDDISRIHDKIMTTFTDSNQCLHSLREEDSCVKELLLQIENQLSSCEAESKELETRVGEVSRDMMVHQLKEFADCISGRRRQQNFVIKGSKSVMLPRQP